jgi:hypothetical protein
MAAGSSSPASEGSDGASEGASESGDEPILIRDTDVIEVVRADVAVQWAALRDAAMGRFPAAKGDGGDSAAVDSIAKRLRRLISGGWLEAPSSGSSSGSGGGHDGRVASQTASNIAGGVSGGRGSSRSVLVDVAAEAPASGRAPGSATEGAVAAAEPSQPAEQGVAGGQRQAQQRQTQQAQEAEIRAQAAQTPGSPWDTPRLEVVEAAEVVEPGGTAPDAAGSKQPQQPAGAKDDGAVAGAETVAWDDDAWPDAGALPAYAVPVTSVLALAMAAVAAAQWWPLLPDVWWGINNGYAADALWQLATAMPDTPATRALMLVGAVEGQIWAG